MGRLQYMTGLWQPNMHEVLPKIWLGNAGAACNKKALQAYGITHIVSVTGHGLNVVYYPNDFIYCVLTAADRPDFKLSKMFDGTNEFIIKALQDGGTVLVHCMFGRSRSATILAAFLIAHLSYTPMAAFALLRNTRSVVCPNPGFVKQTYEWAIETGRFRLTAASSQYPANTAQVAPL